MKAWVHVCAVLGVAGVLVAGCSRGTPTPPPGAKTGPVLELTDANLATTVASGVVLVDFWAPWCGPCRTQGPIVESVAGQLDGRAVVAKLNVDEAPKSAEQYGIRSIPTLIVFKDGKPVKQFVGVTTADALVEAISAAL